MNLLSLYLSHDGCATYIKDHKIVFHTQLDRYNRFKHSSLISKGILDEIEKIEIDKILITYSKENCGLLWVEILPDKLKKKYFGMDYNSIIYFMHIVL